LPTLSSAHPADRFARVCLSPVLTEGPETSLRPQQTPSFRPDTDDDDDDDEDDEDEDRDTDTLM
jgi:hypothetical protein